MSIPSSTNADLVNEFYEFMKSNGSSERHQNNSLRAIIAFVKFLGSDVCFLDIQRKEQVTSFSDKNKKCRTRSRQEMDEHLERLCATN